MDTFKKLNLIEKRNMAIEELVNYYAEYRIYCYNKGDKLKGIELRKRIHPLLNTKNRWNIIKRRKYNYC